VILFYWPNQKGNRQLLFALHFFAKGIFADRGTFHFHLIVGDSKACPYWRGGQLPSTAEGGQIAGDGGIPGLP